MDEYDKKEEEWSLSVDWDDSLEFHERAAVRILMLIGKKEDIANYTYAIDEGRGEEVAEAFEKYHYQFNS